MEEGRKLDGDKLRWDLLPIECVEDVVKILTFGAKKYAPNNWKKVPDAKERYYAAAMRHLAAWRTGEEVDTESGISHLSHLMCNIVFLSWLEKQKPTTEISVGNYRMEFINLGTNAQRLEEIGTSAVPAVKES